MNDMISVKIGNIFRMTISNWTEVIDKDFPHVEKVTQIMVESPRRLKHLMRGSTRLITSRLSTTSELRERRRQARKPLF